MVTKAQLKGTVSLLFILTVLCFFTSCASMNPGYMNDPNLSQADKAGYVGKDLTKAYIRLYNKAKFYTDYGTPDEKEFVITKVNPVLNDLKYKLVDYNKLVNEWVNTGVMPIKFKLTEEQVNKLIYDATDLFIQYGLGGVENGSE
ncbi:MAG: hypothetical protein RBR32_11535 [Bacteroidales bacterium]|nr:hypothetical protein [Bacteroidales bacterium]